MAGPCGGEGGGPGPGSQSSCPPRPVPHRSEVGAPLREFGASLPVARPLPQPPGSSGSRPARTEGLASPPPPRASPPTRPAPLSTLPKAWPESPPGRAAAGTSLPGPVRLTSPRLPGLRSGLSGFLLGPLVEMPSSGRWGCGTDGFLRAALCLPVARSLSAFSRAIVGRRQVVSGRPPPLRDWDVLELALRRVWKPNSF